MGITANKAKLIAKFLINCKPKLRNMSCEVRADGAVLIFMISRHRRR